MASHIGDTTTLANGVQMPWLGLGTFKAQQNGEVEQSVQWALELGYRSIDTASAYGNEAGVAQGLRQSGVPREQIFVTTKVWNSDQGYDATRRAFEQSLQRLQMEYVDLYLIHWPVPEHYLATWQALEAIYEEGLVKAIGVSNFLVHHLQELLRQSKVVPMVNQIEFHPLLQQPKLLQFCAQRNIQVEAWSPLMRGEVFEINAITEMARKYHKTPAQLVLRWNLERRIVTIPKTVHRDRIVENADIFDFQISRDDISRLDALDRERRIGPDPDNFNF